MPHNRCRPVDVNADNAQIIRDKLLGVKSQKAGRYKIGQLVRIARAKHKLKKGYLANFTEEIFEITHKLPRQPPVYRIKDLKGEPIIGIFYEAELTPAI